MQRFLDGVEHYIAAAKDDLVWYTQDAPTPLAQPSIAAFVVHPLLRFVVRRPVQFDDQPCIEAYEISDEWPDRDLAAEFDLKSS